ncbi:7936_t:CDS:2, partial [Paraglomus occultum]
MYVFLFGAFLSFGVGYIARNLDLVNRFYESFSNISSTTHKQYLLVVLLILSLLFLAILIPLYRIVEYESKSDFSKRAFEETWQFLNGWNVRSFTICVAGVISNVKLEDLDAAISALKSNRYPLFASMDDVWGAPPTVL